jgi:hypothetical protein
MGGMGPPPKPNARRRNATMATTSLPAEGRKGTPPLWPLPADIVQTERRNAAQRAADDIELQLADPDITGRKRGALKRKLDASRMDANVLTAQLDSQARQEAELWVELWATPQAVAWERMAWTREVAQYVRWKIAAEQGNLDASKEARQLADRLGLTPLALLRLRWEIVADEVDDARRARPARKPSGKRPPDDPRSLLHAVN